MTDMAQSGTTLAPATIAISPEEASMIEVEEFRICKIEDHVGYAVKKTRRGLPVTAIKRKL